MSRGTFSVHDPGFASFLRDVGAAARPDGLHFVARNFQLDEHPSTARAAAYGVAGVPASHSDAQAWVNAHSRYLDRAINLLNPGLSATPYRIDAGRPDICPETFRFPEAIQLYGGADKNLLLIRMVKAERIADLLDQPRSDPTAFLGLCRAFLADPSDTRIRQELDDNLAVLSEKLDLRPVFSAFFQDVRDEFDEPDWADRLRNRMGLAHISPSPSGPAPVVVFRYAVKEVPPFSGRRDDRPLAVPSVLDSMFFPSFCPAPSDQDKGQLVDLSSSFQEPVHEILHGWMRLTPQHLYRTGQVTSAPPEDLSEARGTHLTYIQASCGPTDYGKETDSDIIDVI